MEEIASFEKSTGNKVKPTWAGNVDIKKRIAAGEVYDVVVASASIECVHQARQDCL